MGVLERTLAFGGGVTGRVLLKYLVENDKDTAPAVWADLALMVAAQKAAEKAEDYLNPLIPFAEAGLIRKNRGKLAEEACQVVKNGSLLRKFAEKSEIPLDLLTMIFDFAGLDKDAGSPPRACVIA